MTSPNASAFQIVLRPAHGQIKLHGSGQKVPENIMIWKNVEKHVEKCGKPVVNPRKKYNESP